MKMTPNEIFGVSLDFVRDSSDTGDLDDQLSRVVEGYIRGRRHDLLSNASALFDPNIHGLGTWRILTQIEALFKKNSAFSVDEECEANAKQSFWACERRCRITNRRLDYYYMQPDRLDPDLRLWLKRMERWVTDVLGERSEFLTELPKLLRVTSGATATRSRKQSVPHLKVSRRWYGNAVSNRIITELAEGLGYKVKTIPLDSNRVEFVPKSWKTHRTIACEPDSNVPVQLAVDTYVKRRLQRVGIDLSDQCLNQSLAKEGSVTGDLATIDLENASDTISYNAVAWVFPTPWFQLLDSIRSPNVRLKDGAVREYAKFSSMGNGSTFVIETLLFAAACAAVGSKRFSVYGDDVIIETELVESLLKLMKFLGFRINKSKSFWHGPFRESCGTHWWEGKLCTPFYLRLAPQQASDWCHVINGLAAIALPEGRLWKTLSAFIKRERLPLVPFDAVSTHGIWIDANSAWTQGLIKSEPEKRLFRTTRIRGELLTPDGWIGTVARQSLKRRTSRYVARYRGLVPVHTKQVVSDTRTLFLWYWEAFRLCKAKRKPKDLRPVWLKDTEENSRFDWEEQGFEPSLVPTSSAGKYRNKWICWYPPAITTPAHLYWWSDYLTP